MLLRQLFDPESSTYTYLLADEQTREAVLIDPVRDQVERDTQLLDELGLELLYTLDTHVHADHITASGVLRSRMGSKSVLSKHAGTGCPDIQVQEGDELHFGSHTLKVIETPGHTDGCLTYYEPEGGHVFTGDALLIRGCGRTDFQQGDSRRLYHSIGKLFALPDTTNVWPGHDYRGRTVSSVGEEKLHNPRLAGKSEDEFVAIMDGLNLQAPKKIAEALPANLTCGMTETMAAEQPTERGWAPIERMSDGTPEVDGHWLANHRDDVVVIDVRQAEEYVGDLGHITGSQLIPLGQLQEMSNELSREQPFVVVCRSGRRSADAARTLEALGFKRVASLRGGMQHWNTAGLPISRSAKSA